MCKFAFARSQVKLKGDSVLYTDTACFKVPSTAAAATAAAATTAAVGEYGMHDPQVLEILLDWGVQAELVLGDAGAQLAGSSGVTAGEADSGGAASSSKAYLKQKLHYSEDGTKLLDADGGWWVDVVLIQHVNNK